MEMERINENTIRVLVSNDDLSARGITILDLLGDHQQIEDFFYSILKEVDTEHQFQNNDAVTFQVMPTSNGLELFISKNDSNASNGQHNFVNDQVTDYIKQQIINGKDKRQSSIVEEENNAINNYQPQWQVIVFNSFEDLIDFTRAVDDKDIESYLYKYDEKYYLALAYRDLAETDVTLKDRLAIAYEYGNPAQVTADFLQEHGKLLMNSSALQLIEHYFN